MWSRRQQIAVYDIPREDGGQIVPGAGIDLFVDGVGGGTGATGRDWKNAIKTMDEAFDKLEARQANTARSANFSRIFVKNGIYENLTTPAGVTDVSIIGCGNKPRHDNLTDAQKMGAAAWRTASGVTASPLLIVRSQGWSISNMLLAPPSAEAGIQLLRDTTYDSSHFKMTGCRVAGGKYGITNNGGAGFVKVKGNVFQTQTTASIECLTTAIAVPLMWEVEDNWFAYGSASHILSSASNWLVRGNTFTTVASTAKYVDLTHNSGQGLVNFVTGNHLGGLYDTSDYVASATDDWTGNTSADVAEAEVADNGITILIPAAP